MRASLRTIAAAPAPTASTAGQQELAQLLSAELGVNVAPAQRMTVQGFVIEVREGLQLRKPTWWAKATQSGRVARAEPMVLYRRGSEPWRSLIRRVDGSYRTATLDQAVLHLREKLACWP